MPYCGSSTIAREPGQWEWIWLIAPAGSFLIRMLLTFPIWSYRGEPGAYRCGKRLYAQLAHHSQRHGSTSHSVISACARERIDPQTRARGARDNQGSC
jgi:hypothetical protein